MFKTGFGLVFVLLSSMFLWNYILGPALNLTGPEIAGGFLSTYFIAIGAALVAKDH